MKTAIIELLFVVFLFGVSVGFCSEAPKPGQVITVTLLGGKQITGKITKLDLNRLTLFHSEGVATIPFEKLSLSDQKVFGYDPQAQARVERAELAKSAKAKEELERQKPINTSDYILPTSDFDKKLKAEMEASEKLLESSRGAKVQAIISDADGRVDYLPPKYLQEQETKRASLRGDRPEPVPLGGSILYTIPRSSLDSLKPKFFLFIIRDANGAEVLRHTPTDFDVKANDYGGFYANGGFEIKFQLQAPFHVELIDDIRLKKSVFEVSPVP